MPLKHRLLAFAWAAVVGALPLAVSPVAFAKEACAPHRQLTWILQVKTQKIERSGAVDTTESRCAPFPESGTENALLEVRGTQKAQLFRRKIFVQMKTFHRRGSVASPTLILTSFVPEALYREPKAKITLLRLKDKAVLGRGPL